VRWCGVAFLLALAGCRPTGPFDVELRLLSTPLPEGVTCTGLPMSFSGFECASPDGVCLVSREVEALEVHLEVVEVPASVIGARVAEILATACPTAGACPVQAVGEPLRVSCGGAPGGTCLVRELGRLDAMLDAVLGPAEIDVRGAAMFRLVLNDASPGCERGDGSCVLGCAYTLPLVLGSGPVEAALALDVSGGCTAGVLRACVGFAGVP
jgi:hypothetical protein